nr:uncharacterized protein LOC127326283 [Lolium perenne]
MYSQGAAGDGWDALTVWGSFSPTPGPSPAPRSSPPPPAASAPPARLLPRRPRRPAAAGRPRAIELAASASPLASFVAGPVASLAAHSASIPPGPALAVHLRFLRPNAFARLRDARLRRGRRAASRPAPPSPSTSTSSARILGWGGAYAYSGPEHSPSDQRLLLLPPLPLGFFQLNTLAEENFRTILRVPVSGNAAEEDPKDDDEGEERVPRKAAPRPTKRPHAKASGSEAGGSGEASAKKAKTNFGDPTNLTSTPKAYATKIFSKLTEAEKWELEQDLLNSMLDNAWGKPDVESSEIQDIKKETGQFLDRLLCKRKEQQALHYELHKNIALQRRVTLSQMEKIKMCKQENADLKKQLSEAQGASSSLATASSELETLCSTHKDLEAKLAEAEKKLAEKKSELIRKEGEFELKRKNR